KGWLLLCVPPDGVLSPQETGRILRELQPAFETPPEAYNPYFIRALVTTTVGNWWDAQDDLKKCKEHLHEGELPSDVTIHNEWYIRASGPPTEFLDYTQVLLDTLPLMPDVRIRLGEEVIRLLQDPEILKRDDLSQDTARVKLGLTHQRLAKL